MADVTVYGFPISTFVNIVRLVLTHKNVATGMETVLAGAQCCHCGVHERQAALAQAVQHGGFEMPGAQADIDVHAAELQQELLLAAEFQRGEQLLLPLFLIPSQP